MAERVLRVQTESSNQRQAVPAVLSAMPSAATPTSTRMDVGWIQMAVLPVLTEQSLPLAAQASNSVCAASEPKKGRRRLKVNHIVWSVQLANIAIICQI
tara:strand:+ start:2217 stop:2513 length:297 start_codon:yes stop_codon:yes gene_type:complete